MRLIKVKRWRAASRNSDKVSVLTLLGVSELLKIRGKWSAALRLSNIALHQSRGLGTLTEGLALLSVGHAYRNQTPEDHISAQHHLRMAKLLLEGLPPSDDQAFYLMRAVLLLGDTLVRREDMGDMAEAEELAHLAERLLRKSRDAQAPPARGFRWTLFTGSWRDFCLHSMVELGEIYYYTSRWAEGEKLLRELVPTLVENRGKRHVTTIEAQRDLASMLVNQDKYEEAEMAYRTAREWNDRVPVFGHEEKAAIDYNIAMCLSERGKDEEARAEIARMDLAADLLHYANGEWTLKLARLTSLRLKRYDEVVALCLRFQRVLDEHTARFGLCSPVTLRNMEDHATALKALRRYDEAIDILRDMCRREASDVARVVEQTLETRLNLAHTLRYAGHHEEAAYEYRKCLELERAASEDYRDDAQVRNILKYLAYLYELAGDRTNALIAYSQLQSEYWARPSLHRNFVKYEWYRGKMFMLQGRWNHALQMLLGALALRKGIETVVALITGRRLEAAAAAAAAATPHAAQPQRRQTTATTTTTTIAAAAITTTTTTTTTPTPTTTATTPRPPIQPSAPVAAVVLDEEVEQVDELGTDPGDHRQPHASEKDQIAGQQVNVEEVVVAAERRERKREQEHVQDKDEEEQEHEQNKEHDYEEDKDEEDEDWDEVDWWEEAIKDAVDAVRCEQPFQACPPLDEADSEVDDNDDDGMAAQMPQTVDVVMSTKTGYPVVPAEDEWSQPQWPRLPDTYEELVVQQRRVTEESRPWDP